MTDTYIWQKIRQRFLDIDKVLTDKDQNEYPIIVKEYNEDGDITGYTNVVEPNDVEDRQVLLQAMKDFTEGFGNTGIEHKIWFEIFPLHTQPRQQELGTTGRNRWTFGFQININSHKGVGTYVIDSVYDAIAAQFKRGDIFDGIRVIQTAYRSSARLYDDYYSEPVTIMVQADLEN